MRLNTGYILLLLCLASCSFNKSFYRAEKIPAGVKKAVITNYMRDTSWLTYLHIGDNFQPTFTNDKEEPLTTEYTIESVVFKNMAGHKLNGWFIKPIGKKPTTTLLILHGNGGNVTKHFYGAANMAKQGFQAFVFDYSGYGFSEGKPTRKNILNDATSALAYIRTRPDVAGTKIVIYGQSLGGHLAAAAAQKNEQLIDGVVMEGAFSSHKEVAATRFPIKFLAMMLVKEQYSAFRSIRQFHKPVLVIHSTEDESIPFWMGKKIYDNANNPKSFYEIRHRHIWGSFYYADSIAHKINTMVKG
ncbi:MAG: hydrolase or acyltransferase, alpha/beta fold family [Flavipsychrobacter sp.]|jgi:fermentation-respiration switch protein FrsA (DUF1100 family)|nr:hydrolase or acyltransferase, alpha/beta fold family [Flavipsychrobacter sp.]